jgi:hypothetical protein
LSLRLFRGRHGADGIEAPDKAVACSGPVFFERGDDVAHAPAEGALSVWAHFVVNGKATMKRNQVDLLFWDPTQWDNPGRQPFCRPVGVGCQAPAPLHFSCGEVHQNRLGHVVEVVAESHHVSTRQAHKGVDPLSTEDPAIRARKARSLWMAIKD